jgi:hypothetical protein
MTIETDRRIAEAMGLRIHERATECSCVLHVVIDGLVCSFSPFVAIADAFLVVDRMRGLGWRFSCESNYPLCDGSREWRARFRRKGEHQRLARSANASELPQAICEAALKAIEKGADRG